MANLRVLDLHNNQIQDAGLLHLLSSPGLRNVEELCLVRCQLTSASARMLACFGKGYNLFKYSTYGTTVCDPPMR